MNRSSFLYGSTVFVVLVAVVAAESSAAGAPDDIGGSHTDKLAEIQHTVVIYQENHSFDNLYGGWEGCERTR